MNTNTLPILKEGSKDPEVIKLKQTLKKLNFYGAIDEIEETGDLFCGDLLENIDKPNFSSIIDDLIAANTSIENLKSLKINMVYPGHGKPFSMKAFETNSKQIANKSK